MISRSRPGFISRTILLAAAATLCWSAPSAAQERKSESAEKATQAKETKGKKGDAQTDPTLVVLVPHVIVMDENFANGCWVRLHEDENFRGGFITLVGPADVVSMRTRFGNWVRKWESVIVGPRTTVAAYDNENFQQKVANFKPGQRVPDLDPKMGFFENIRSMRITCSK